GLAKNKRLARAIAGELIQAKKESKISGKPARRFKEFSWSTRKSWSGKRRVIWHTALFTRQGASSRSSPMTRHRLLFVRFLVENNLLISPEHAVSVSLDDCEELSPSLGLKDAWSVAAPVRREATARNFPRRRSGRRRGTADGGPQAAHPA